VFIDVFAQQQYMIVVQLPYIFLKVNPNAYFSHCIVRYNLTIMQDDNLTFSY